ncbi:probable long-chain-alcohol O-fatty-acyltransferase 5 [Typha latifolia]|uniref:probable long-chain-alcohol O-fatty-acyltransferase 5 n=1 Tax=Typha latifolia TaxID=4733 RepID=UPI003C2B237E
MEADLRSVAKFSLVVCAFMAYARFASAHLRPGLPRLISLLPLLLLFPFLPFSFSSIHLRGISAFFLVWLSLFKLLLLSFDRGPLHPSLPLLSFVFVASLPVKLHQSKPEPKPTSHFNSLLSSTIKVLLLAFLLSLYRFKNQMNHYLLLGLYCIHMYLALELVLASAKAIACGVLGMDLEPQFNKPYFSSSLRDFWGRRWNLMVSAVLRPAVYGPVKSRWGTAAGVVATFLVSGLMHEVMFYYLTLRSPTGEVTAFFLVNGVSVAAEGRWAGRKGWWRPPKAVATPLTLGFVAATGFWLFFPPIIRSGTDEVVLEECGAMMAFLERTGRQLLGSTGSV